MDTPKLNNAGSAGLRRWTARYFVAMIAAAVVLATLAWKNQRQSTGWLKSDYGWPRRCVNRHYVTDLDSHLQHLEFTPLYNVTSWPSLLLDASIAVASVIAVWTLFSHTQQRCQQWWQVSLSTVFAFVVVAAVVCAVLKSASSSGW